MTDGRAARLAATAAWVSAILMLGAWAVVSLLGDRFWLALPFLYGPRWVAGALFLGVVPAVALARRSAWRAALVMLGFYLFGVLDLRLGIGRLEPARDVTIRVMELNAGAGSPGRGPTPDAVVAEMVRLHADVLVVAECSASLAEGIGARDGWQVRRSVSSVCLGSRYPVLTWEVRDPMDFWRANGSGAISRATLDTPAGVVRIGLVHLETPRDALDNFGDLSTIPTLGNITRENTAAREHESAVAREWIFRGETLPTIVAGDFNLPIESAVYRRHWGGLRNALSRGGIGFVDTKHTRRWGIRIDHILTTGEIVTRRAIVGRDVGSDHRPVLAELSLTRAQRTSSAR